MEDHEIDWEVASLRADRLFSGDFRLLFSAANALGRRSCQQLGIREQRLSPHIRRDGSSFSAPSHLLLENVTFGRDGQPATTVAKTVDIGLSIRQLTAPLHVDTILLQDGTLNISVQTAPFPFEADRLQLRNMALNSPGSEWRLSAQRVNGGVMPRAPRPVGYWAIKPRSN